MYVWRTLRHELSDSYSKFKEIVRFHHGEYQSNCECEERRRNLLQGMKQAVTFEEWKICAEEFDNMQDKRIWREAVHSEYYDYKYIIHLRDLLRNARLKQNDFEIIHIIRSHCFRDISGILNKELYINCYLQTKQLIHEFINEFLECLNYIATESSISPQKKVEFFIETRHAFGRTALMLSGGAIFGLYHSGVIKVLHEHNLLPKVITGSSAGSLIAGFFFSRREEEFPNCFKPGYWDFSAFEDSNKGFSIWRKIKRILTTGYLLDPLMLQKFARDNIGDVTFQEAFDRTGWILNITVTGYGDHDKYRLLNYLTAPNVLIWSAACASCAIPYVYGPVDLYCKDNTGEIVIYIQGGRKFVDGSIGADLPRQRISEFFNVNSFMVSQTNPWAILWKDKKEKKRYQSRWKIIFQKVFDKIAMVFTSELRHRIFQLTELGIIPDFLSFYSNLFIQSYQGDLTVSPIPRFRDYMNILGNPSEEAVLRSCDIMERRIFDKVTYIHAMVDIERALDSHHRALKRRYEGSLSLAMLIPQQDNMSDLSKSSSEESNSEEECIEHEKGISDSKVKRVKRKKNMKNTRVGSFIIPRTTSVNRTSKY